MYSSSSRYKKKMSEVTELSNEKAKETLKPSLFSEFEFTPKYFKPKQIENMKNITKQRHIPKPKS